MDDAIITSLRERANIVIHAASSINLRHNLSRIAPTIVQGTLNVADFALSCPALDRFVYISTAYANAHLHYLDPTNITQVSERIYPLQDETGMTSDADTEWLCLQKYGTTSDFEANSFPWPYAYAKHLTERLLVRMFQTSGSSVVSETSSCDASFDISAAKKLMIVRPSIIGPAHSFPAPGWQVASSAPVTGLLAFLILTPANRLTFYSQFDDPNREAIIDEVPVDVVANRVLMHILAGTPGIVHANSKATRCYRFGEYIQASQRLRRLPYSTKIKWNHDPHSAKICMIAKLYQVGGCTFDFEDVSTSNLWYRMQQTDQDKFPLFTAEIPDCKGRRVDLSGRDEGFRRLFAAYFRRRKWPGWLTPVFYCSS